MISRKWLLALVLPGALLWQGCSSQSNAASEGRICTPGAYVFCRCADRAEGTKLCNDDGSSFQACATSATGECVGGEVEDPDTGKPVTEEDPIKNEIPPATVDEVDACPGKAISLQPGVETSIDGDTTTAKSDYQGKADGACAAGKDGKDHVYHVVPKGQGQLSVKVQGTDGYDPTVYVRTDCTSEASQKSCAETTAAGGLEQLRTSVLTGADYYIVVDGAGSTAGKYKLTMKLTTGSFCGDGKVDTNEACDDGNNDPNDGCGSDCRKIEGDPTSGNGCATGHSIDVWQGQTVNGSGSTNTYGNAWTKTGTSCSVSSSDLNAAPEHIYKVTAHAAGTLKVVVTPEATFNVQVEARTACADPATQGSNMCANLGSAGAAETMQFAVTSGQVVYVGVDGALNAKGAYTFTMQIQ